MQIKLDSLTIHNFKGVHDYRCDFNGANAVIKGKNGVGKTSIYDAFLYLLFGKNSLGESTFPVLPNGEPEAVMEISVVINIDGEKKLFAKKIAPKYSKKTAEYTGSELTYYINGVPAKAKEYEAAISEIISEDTFKLLTNVKYITELDWKKRRDILFTLCDTLPTDEEIINSSDEYSALKNHIGRYGSVDNILKVKNSERKANVERLTAIPQIMQSLNPNGITEDIEKVKANINKLNSDIEALKIRRKNDIDSVMKAREYAKNAKDALIQRNADYRKNQHSEKDMLERTVDALKRLVRSSESQLVDVANMRKKASDEYYQLDKQLDERKNANYSEAPICKTCGQKISLEQWETENHKKIVELGIALEKADSEWKNLDSKVKSLTAELEMNKSKLFVEEEKLSKAKGVENMPEYEKLLASADAEIKRCNELPGESEIAANYSEHIQKLNALLDAEIDKASEIKANAEKVSKLRDLKAEQAELRNKQAEVLAVIDAAEALVKAKVDMTEEAVNSKFRYVRFKFFEKLKTQDGFKDCCEITANNAPSYSQINTAHKVLAGMDIIRVFSEKLNIRVPLFVDNIDGLDSESFDELKKLCNTQLIALIVSDDKALTTIKEGE